MLLLTNPKQLGISFSLMINDLQKQLKGLETR